MSDLKKRRLFKPKIGVYTEDHYLFRKIVLDAADVAEVIKAENSSRASFDIILADIDTASPPSGVSFLSMSRKKTAEIPLPFPIDTIKKLCTGSEEAPTLTINEKARSAILHGEQIKLTEVEFSLLSKLVSKGGDFSTREELLSEIWGGSADSGVINVYVHYLREKLEKRGEKIILSSRKSGYKIDGKYLGGKQNA